MDYNSEAVIDAIVASDASPAAKEIAAPLVEEWIQRFGAKDLECPTIAVEAPFYVWLDAGTLVVGVIDRITDGIFGCEWKTTKEGSKWWTEDRWLASLDNGSQIKVYGLALHKGKFGLTGWMPHVEAPVKIFVRAAVKSTPPDFWGSTFLTVSAEAIQATETALLQKAAAIRAMRKRKSAAPWQLTGRQCFEFNRACVFHEKFCSKFTYPIGDYKLFDPSDPGSQALALAGINALDAVDPKLVIFSASSYDTASVCLERYRLKTSLEGSSDTTPEMEVGTATHAGLAEFYRQTMRS